MYKKSWCYKKNGKLFILGGAINHFKCGIVQEQIYKLNKIFNENKKDQKQK